MQQNIADDDYTLRESESKTGKTLFIDARNMGHMVDRKHRDFSEKDIARLADTSPLS